MAGISRSSAGHTVARLEWSSIFPGCDHSSATAVAKRVQGSELGLHLLISRLHSMPLGIVEYHFDLIGAIQSLTDQRTFRCADGGQFRAGADDTISRTHQYAAGTQLWRR